MLKDRCVKSQIFSRSEGVKVFKKLELSGWRQFEKIDIDFHSRLTILTGVNGSGKTTILNILNKDFAWHRSFIGVPIRNQKTGGFIIWSGLKVNEQLDYKVSENVKIGVISYKDGQSCDLKVNTEVSTKFEISYEYRNNPRRNHVDGIHISSHRPFYLYTSVEHLRSRPITRREAFSDYIVKNRSRFSGNNHDKSPNYSIKESLLSFTLGFGNDVVERDDEAVALFKGFEEILRRVLPPKLGFENLSIRSAEIVLVTKSGDFLLDAVSGGVASIIDLAWQLHLFDKENFVITIDEPENHLHPEMQRSLLPNFLEAFPNVQFIISTHSPFIISSVPESNVYVLDYNAENRVESMLLENVEKSGGANDILRDVLGLETTLPIWTEEKINSIINKYSQQGINNDNIKAFKEELNEVGLGKYIPSSLITLLDEGVK